MKRLYTVRELLGYKVVSNSSTFSLAGADTLAIQRMYTAPEGTRLRVIRKADNVCIKEWERVAGGFMVTHMPESRSRLGRSGTHGR